MQRWFADTFYFLALLNPRDVCHDRVRELNRTARAEIVTTGWVLTEVGDAMAGQADRRLFLQFLSKLRASPGTLVVPFSDLLFEEGIELYGSRPDMDWSLTDCISFVVMEAHGINEVLTGDHHFEQAGFRSLLK